MKSYQIPIFLEGASSMLFSASNCSIDAALFPCFLLPRPYSISPVAGTSKPSSAVCRKGSNVFRSSAHCKQQFEAYVFHNYMCTEYVYIHACNICQLRYSTSQ